MTMLDLLFSKEDKHDDVSSCPISGAVADSSQIMEDKDGDIVVETTNAIVSVSATKDGDVLVSATKDGDVSPVVPVLLLCSVTHPDANMAFDLRPTEDVLPWLGGANIAFDLNRSCLDDIDADINVTLVNEALNDEDLFGVNDLDGEEVIVDEEVVKTVNEEITLAQTLIEIKSTKPKAKGIVMEEPSESTLIISLQQPSQVKAQDKGKAKMVEVKEPKSKKDQIKFDEELSLKLQAKEESLAKQKEEDANIAKWDDI
ncbi:hypothetical protein Tco_0480801 [Tanacetum coccineum]